jgi:desulfoferrodoxin (superoxide reductase-like protein)
MIELHDGEGAATVTVMHGMSVEHWISDIYLRNQDDIIIGYVELTGEDPEARARFDLPRGTTRITAYAYCNLHDHWTADSVRV